MSINKKNSEEKEMQFEKEKSTDMDKVKAVAKHMLHMPIVKGEFWPVVAQHPFASSGSFTYTDENGELKWGELEEDTPDYDCFIKSRTELIERAESAPQLACWLNKPWRPLFAKLVALYCSKADLSEIMACVLCETERLNCDPNCSPAEIVRLIKACDKAILMGEDFEAYKMLPDTIKVYRGVTSFYYRNRSAISWTTDIETAKFFATRYDEKGIIFSAEIEKKHVLAYFEYESTVVLEPRYLKNNSVFAEYGTEY